MNRTCSLETMVRESDDRQPTVRENDLTEGLRAAVVITHAKIDGAFAHAHKFSAKLKRD